MKLRTVVRDCLFLNWALPADSLPEPPAPLRYQLHGWQGRDHVFASALLFHHDAVRWSAFPLLRMGYPQLNLRLYVLDEDGVPSVLLLRELMPAWVAPGVRLVSHHPAAGAHLDFPRPSRQPGSDSWSWQVERGTRFTVRARVHSPTFGEGPRIGSWEETVSYIQDRPRGYALHRGALHRVDAWHPPVEAAGVWPLAAEMVGDDALLRRNSPAGNSSDPSAPPAPAERLDSGHSLPRLPGLHSSWLCPEMPFSIAFDLVPRVQPRKALVQQLPHPAAGRVGSPALRAGSPFPEAAAAAPAEMAARSAAAAVLASAA